MKYLSRIAFVAVSAMVLVAGAVWLLGNRSLPAFADANDATVEQRQNQLKAYAEHGEQSRKGVGNASATKISLNLRDVADIDSRLVALSPDEVVWMRNHYYPTEAQLKSLGALSLEGMAGTKDPMLGTLYGMALVARGESAAGISVLNSAAARGSIFAYQEAAIAEYEMLTKRLGENREIKNVLRAKLEVAKNMGDYRSDDLAEKYLPDYNAGSNSSTVLSQVSEFTRQLGENSQTLGVQAPGPDPRPNEAQWRDMKSLLNAGGNVEVDIYRP